MKKIHKTLMVAGIGIISLSSSAQVSAYSFLQYQGSYNAVSGGTVFGTSGEDDTRFANGGSPTVGGNTGPGIQIGFPFIFNNITFDVFGINNNGWIAFGQSTLTPNPVDLNSSSNYTGISATSTAPGPLQHRVVALGRDLQGNSVNSNLRVETIGTTPNRVCVIQWSNYRLCCSGTDDYSFQIRLHETSNKVQVVYGPFVAFSANAAEVGLRGATNADFNNRSVVAPNAWATSIAGTANTSNAAWNNTGLIPNSGQVYEWNVPVPCAGAPALSSAISVFNEVCPTGSTGLSLSSTYTNTGITYQWYHSDVSAVGPYTLIATPSATNPSYNATNITTPMWYRAVVACNAGPVSTTMTAVNVLIEGTTINNIPYHEGFEGILQNNQLPNCSWSRSNPLTTLSFTTAAANNRIPHTGNKFGAFRYGTAAAGDYFYTNGLQLQAGITYSADVWYTTDGNVGWSEFSLHYGLSQTPAGLTSIASVTGAVTGTFYQNLGSTFTVPNSGIYYIAIKGRGNSSPQFMSFDDLSVTIPCSLNSPTVTTINTPTIACSGQELSITASGADTYTWSTGDQTSTTTFTPFAGMNVTLLASSALSGCTSTITQFLNVANPPGVSIFSSSNSQSICAGSAATLHAVGANSYTWSSGSFGPSTIVSPTSPTNYTVLGSNGSGCIGYGVFMLGINNTPVVTASASVSELCVGETVTLTGSGALNYQWKANSIVILTSPAEVSPNSSITYTLVGTDANGCSGTSLLALNVNACVGLNELSSGLKGIKVYPNPTHNSFTIELVNGLEKQVQVMDLTGRVVLTTSSSDEHVKVNIAELAAGIYYVKIISGNGSEVLKIVKN